LNTLVGEIDRLRLKKPAKGLVIPLTGILYFLHNFLALLVLHCWKKIQEKRLEPMTSRKWIGTVLITLVVVAVLVAGGFALYRFGYSRGVMATSTGEGLMFHDFERMPFLEGRMGNIPRENLRDFQENFQGRFVFSEHSFDPRSIPFGYSIPSRSFVSPFTFVLRVLFFGVIVWLLYKFIKLFTAGNSWQLSFNSTQDAEHVEKADKKN